MNFLNPAVTSGVDIFVNIVVILVAFALTLTFLDVKSAITRGDGKEDPPAQT